MPSFPPARVFPPGPPLPLYKPKDETHDIAIVVVTRHGERGIDKNEKDLTPDGYERAAYMNKCIGDAPSVAFPLGAPTRLLASLRDDSDRPVETLTPLATKLALEIETADMMDLYAIQNLIPTLQPNDQLLVSWQHWFIPRMILTLSPPNPHPPMHFPEACNTSEWHEPDYTRESNGGDCYDIIWQFVLVRPKANPKAPWRTVTYNQMLEGYGGTADSVCAEALSLIERK